MKLGSRLKSPWYFSGSVEPILVKNHQAAQMPSSPSSAYQSLGTSRPRAGAARLLIWTPFPTSSEPIQTSLERPLQGGQAFFDSETRPGYRFVAVCDIENGPVEIVDLPITKWWFSIVLCMFTRWFRASGFHMSHVSSQTRWPQNRNRAQGEKVVPQHPRHYEIYL